MNNKAAYIKTAKITILLSSYSNYMTVNTLPELHRFLYPFFFFFHNSLQNSNLYSILAKSRRAV